jgi:hypothetical protein
MTISMGTNASNLDYNTLFADPHPLHLATFKQTHSS